MYHVKHKERIKYSFLHNQSEARSCYLQKSFQNICIPFQIRKCSLRTQWKRRCKRKHHPRLEYQSTANHSGTLAPGRYSSVSKGRTSSTYLIPVRRIIFLIKNNNKGQRHKFLVYLLRRV